MNQKVGNNWMIWAIIALLLLNVTTLATIFYNRHKLLVNDGSAVTVHSNLEVGDKKFSGRYFREKLNFDRNQMGEFSEFNSRFRQNAMEINIGLVTLRNEMLSEMSTNNCDTIRLNFLSDSIGTLHARLKRDTYRYYLDLKEICNDNQDVLLDQLFEDLFTDDVNMGTPGNAWRRGQQ